jgi:hypothetical protein
MLSKWYFALFFVLCFSSALLAVLPDPNFWVAPSLITLTTADDSDGAIYWNPPSKIIDGSGLTVDLKHKANTTAPTFEDLWTYRIDYSRWLWNVPNAPQPNLSPSGIQGDGWAAFEFSTPQTISQIWVWNHNVANNTDRGWKYVAIDYSVDGTTWTRLGGTDYYFTFNQAPGTDGYICNNKIDFGGLTVKKIVMTVRFADGIYGDPQYGGLSEVLFSTDLGLIDPIAESPNPVDSYPFAAATGLTLSWTAGQTAATHDVYLGTDSAVVASASRANPQGVLVSQGQAGTTYAAGVLAAGTTYYWRIDEVESNGLMIWDGDVWSFKTLSTDSGGWINGGNILVAVSSEIVDMPGVRTIDGSGLSADLLHDTDTTHLWTTYHTNGGMVPSPSGSTGAAWIAYEFGKVYQLKKMWVWNYNPTYDPEGSPTGRGFKKVYIDYTSDGATWTRLMDGANDYFIFPEAPGTDNYVCEIKIDFGGADVNGVVLTAPMIDGHYWMDDDYYGLSEVRFEIPRLVAESPSPTDAYPFAATNAVLSWTAGEQAVTHDVYFGTNQAAVATATRANPQGVLVSQGQSGTTYAPALTPGTTYYWRIDEVSSGGLTIWTGSVWSFRTLSADTDGWINGNNILVKVSSEIADMPGTKTIDGSGLSAGLTHDTVSTHFWTTYHTNGGMTPSPSGSTGAVWIAYEFGKVYQPQTMWVWNYNPPAASGQTGRGLKKVHIDYSSNGTSWIRLMDGANDYFVFPEASGLADYASDIKINFGGVNVKYVVLTAPLVDGNYGYDDYHGLSEVRFRIPTSYANTPNPANAGGDVAFPAAVLSWLPGDTAISHNVYFGTDQTAVQNATLLLGDINGSGGVDINDIRVLAEQWLSSPSVSSQYWADITDDGKVTFADFAKIAENWLQSGNGIYRGHYPREHSSYTVGNLNPGEVYYWRVDEVSGGTVWKGSVWSFTTDFE